MTLHGTYILHACLSHRWDHNIKLNFTHKQHLNLAKAILGLDSLFQDEYMPNKLFRSWPVVAVSVITKFATKGAFEVDNHVCNINLKVKQN